MGNFDDLFQELAEVVTELFVSTPATLKRVREVYNEDTDEDATIVDGEVEVLITPPSPYRHREINGVSVLAHHLQSFVPAKPLEDAGFDPTLASGVQLFVTTRGRTYRAVAVNPVPGGDSDAMYELQLDNDLLNRSN